MLHLHASFVGLIMIYDNERCLGRSVWAHEGRSRIPIECMSGSGSYMVCFILLHLDVHSIWLITLVWACLFVLMRGSQGFQLSVGLGRALTWFVLCWIDWFFLLTFRCFLCWLINLVWVGPLEPMRCGRSSIERMIRSGSDMVCFMFNWLFYVWVEFLIDILCLISWLYAL